MTSSPISSSFPVYDFDEASFQAANLILAYMSPMGQIPREFQVNSSKSLTVNNLCYIVPGTEFISALELERLIRVREVLVRTLDSDLPKMKSFLEFTVFCGSAKRSFCLPLLGGADTEIGKLWSLTSTPCHKNTVEEIYKAILNRALDLLKGPQNLEELISAVEDLSAIFSSKELHKRVSREIQLMIQVEALCWKGSLKLVPELQKKTLRAVKSLKSEISKLFMLSYQTFLDRDLWQCDRYLDDAMEIMLDDSKHFHSIIPLARFFLQSLKKIPSSNYNLIQGHDLMKIDVFLRFMENELLEVVDAEKFGDIHNLTRDIRVITDQIIGKSIES